MARIIKTTVQPTVTSVIQTIKTDGTVDSVELKKGDIVTDLRYVVNENICKITGRISNFILDVSKATRKYTASSSVKSYFAQDVKLKSIEVDASKEYQSDIVTVPSKEIVENDGVTDVARMKYYTKYGVSFEITLTDGTVNVFDVQEGQTITGLTYLDSGSEKTVTARLIAIDHDKNLGAKSLVVMIDGTVTQIPIKCVKSIEKTVDPITSGQSITDAISASTDGFVTVSAGTFTDNIVVDKDMVVYGARAGQSASTKEGMKSTDDETVIAGEIKISSGVAVTLDGVTLTDKAYINLSGAGDVTLKNCKILGLTSTAQKTYVVKTETTDNSKIVINNCYFGENPAIPSEDGDPKKAFSVYNLIELQGTLKDGSTFSNNYFAEGCNSHNDINIYQVEEGATITISGNTWERSANGIRLGIKGEPTCNINITDNTYMSTDIENKDYAGLLLIQPYSTLTTSMANMTVNMSNISYKGPLIDGLKPQVYYFYAGPKDMQFTEENVPTIIFNGKVVKAPVKK